MSRSSPRKPKHVNFAAQTAGAWSTATHRNPPSADEVPTADLVLPASAHLLTSEFDDVPHNCNICFPPPVYIPAPHDPLCRTKHPIPIPHACPTQKHHVITHRVLIKLAWNHPRSYGPRATCCVQRVPPRVQRVPIAGQPAAKVSRSS